jgi:ribosomal protein L40E
MKICEKCGFENYGEVSSCNKCGTSLLHIEKTEDSGQAEAFFMRQERKEKRQRILKLLLIPLYYLIYLPFYILCIRCQEESFGVLFLPLLFPILYYLLSFKAEWLFKMEHMHQIDNLDKVEISDYYYMTSQIGAYLLLAAGMFIVIWSYISMMDTADIIVEMERILP